jgi:hypothetical protein
VEENAEDRGQEEIECAKMRGRVGDERKVDGCQLSDGGKA